jgi:hypothetical protein
MLYRSATVYGRGEEVTDAAEKMALMERVFASIVRSDRMAQLPPLDRGYLGGTMVVRVLIEEAVGKVNGAVETGEGAGDIWSGLIPMTVGYGPPTPDNRTIAEGPPPPPEIAGYRRTTNAYIDNKLSEDKTVTVGGQKMVFDKQAVAEVKEKAESRLAKAEAAAKDIMDLKVTAKPSVPAVERVLPITDSELQARRLVQLKQDVENAQGDLKTDKNSKNLAKLEETVAGLAATEPRIAVELAKGAKIDAKSVDFNKDGTMNMLVKMPDGQKVAFENYYLSPKEDIPAITANKTLTKEIIKNEIAKEGYGDGELAKNQLEIALTEPDKFLNVKSNAVLGEAVPKELFGENFTMQASNIENGKVVDGQKLTILNLAEARQLITVAEKQGLVKRNANGELEKIDTGVIGDVSRDFGPDSSAVEAFGYQKGPDAVKLITDRMELLNRELSNNTDMAKQLNVLEGKQAKALKTVEDHFRVQDKKLVYTTADGEVIDKPVLDGLREVLNNQTDKDMSFLIYDNFVKEMVSKSDIFGGAGLRPAQVEMASALMRGDSIGLAMGGGKTVPFGVDLIMHRALYGESVKSEMLLGEGNTKNYVEDTQAVQKLADFVGMKFVDGKEYFKNNRINDLIEAYKDPNTIVVMDPTTRGHLSNQAITNKDLRNALDSVNRVNADEVHLWVLSRTSAVIGDGGKPPEASHVARIQKLFEGLQGYDSKGFTQGKDGKWSQEITVKDANGKDQKITVNRIGSERELKDYLDTSIPRIVQVGEANSASFRLNSKAKEIISGLDKGGYQGHEINSALRGMAAENSAGGARVVDLTTESGAFKKQAVRPINERGEVEPDMILRDTVYQEIVAMEEGKKQGLSGEELNTFVRNAVEVSETTIQTSLSAIYNNPGVKMSGGSGTVLGLQQLILNKVGSRVYDISAERLNTNDFKVETVNDATKADVLRKLMTDPTNKNDNFLLAAKEVDSLNENREIVKTLVSEGKLEGYDIYDYASNTMLTKNSNGEWNWSKDGLEAKKSELQSKTAELKNQREALEKQPDSEAKTEALKNIDKQLKTTDYDPASLNQVASKGVGDKRIIITNEKGFTGVDFQGNFRLIVKDANLMTESNLAQLIKRTGRPNESGGPRWETDRFIMADEGKLNGIKDMQATENGELVNAMKGLWSGQKGEGYVKDDRAMDLMSRLEKGEALSLNEQIELNAKVQELKDINRTHRWKRWCPVLN